MKYAGVTFVDEAVSKMSKAQFIKEFNRTFWQDRDKEVRKKMLSDAYDRITKSNS
jgi:hypothetical protein